VCNCLCVDRPCLCRCCNCLCVDRPCLCRCCNCLCVDRPCLCRWWSSPTWASCPVAGPPSSGTTCSPLNPRYWNVQNLLNLNTDQTYSGILIRPTLWNTDRKYWQKCQHYTYQKYSEIPTLYLCKDYNIDWKSSISDGNKTKFTHYIVVIYFKWYKIAQGPQETNLGIEPKVLLIWYSIMLRINAQMENLPYYLGLSMILCALLNTPKKTISWSFKNRNFNCQLQALVGHLLYRSCRVGRVVAIVHSAQCTALCRALLSWEELLPVQPVMLPVRMMQQSLQSEILKLTCINIYQIILSVIKWVENNKLWLYVLQERKIH